MKFEMRVKNLLIAMLGVGLFGVGIAAHSQSFNFRKTAPGVKVRYIGPSNGGSMFGIALHPTNSDIMLFGGDMGACYRTEDGGKNWDILPGDSFDCPRATWNVRFHPKKHNIVWHLGRGILKSTDSGKSWKNMNAPNGTYCALGLDPDNAEIIYASEGQAPRSVLNWTKGKVVKSIDGGKSWKELSLPYSEVKKRGIKHPNFTNFIIDSNSKIINGAGHARVFIFGRGGLFRSEDAGKTWKDLSAPFGAGQINDMVMTKANGKSTIFLSVAPAVGFEKGGVYKSSNNGESWSAVNKGLGEMLGKLKVQNKKLKAQPESYIYSIMLAHSKAAPKRLYVGSWRGIYRSDNGGKSWNELVPDDDGAYIKDKNGSYMSIPKKGNNFTTTIWGRMDNFNRFIVDQHNPDIVAFSDNQDMYISKDGGKVWASVSFDYGKVFDRTLYKGTAPNRFTHKSIPRGPQNIVSDHVKIDPFDPNTYYCAYMDLGLEISRDGGRTWAHPTKGTPGRGHAWAVVTDPGKQGRLFLTIGQAWGQKGGIYRSEDSGRSWKRIGLKDASMGKLQTVAIDLKSPVNSRLIYVGSEKKGIYKSTDGGDNWQHINGPAKDVITIVISSKSSKVIYAGTASGLFISKNSGKSWVQLGKGKFEKVENLSICRSKPSTIYLTAHYPGKNGYWGEAGFWRSSNNGKSFVNITPAYFKHAGAIAVNPYNPNYIYACNYLIAKSRDVQKLRIVRSKNGGKSWENIGADINCSRARHLLIDQQDPRKFFVLARFSIIEGRDEQAPVK